MSKLSAEEEQRILVFKARRYDLLADLVPEMIALLNDVISQGLLDDEDSN